MWNRTLIVSALVVLALSLPVHAGAQDQTGTLAGCVTDVAGAPVPHATVELSASREVYATVFGDDRGCYEAPLPPGTYVFVAKLTGFASVTRDELTVVPGGRLRVDFRMKVPPMCECLTVSPPTVGSLWEEADLVARVRITGHDRQFEYERSPRVVHSSVVLNLWKATANAGQVGNTIQFNQHPGGPRYAVGDEFVLFLVARSGLQIAGAFKIVDGRVHGQQLTQFLEYNALATGFLGQPADELVAEIAVLAGNK